jgi:hypothetical protein
MGPEMSSLSFKFAKALASGRAPRVLTRERILADLLRKRAAASQARLFHEERQLRQQVLWALPMRKPTDEAPDAVNDDAVAEAV